MSDPQPVTWYDDPAHFRKASRREFLFTGLVGGLGLSLGNLFKLRALETDVFEPKAQSFLTSWVPARICPRMCAFPAFRMSSPAPATYPRLTAPSASGATRRTRASRSAI